MTTRRTIDEKKQEFNVKWQGKIDDKFIDYNLPIKSNQKFICLKNDIDHNYSSYFDEDEKYVIFTSTLYRMFNNSNCCPICIKQSQHKPPTNKISQVEIDEKIKLHENNIQQINGKQTILISPYINMQSDHIFECSCGKQFNRAMTDALRQDRMLLCLNCSKKAYKHDEIQERKKIFNEKWINIIDDSLIDYSKSTKEVQSFICLKQDINHKYSELYNEDKEHVIFNSTIDQVLRNENHSCPICITEWRQQEAYNKLSEEEINTRIKQHLNNKCNEFGQQTQLISKYAGMSEVHDFQCICGNLFQRRMTDILRNDRSFYCLDCSYTGASRIALEWLSSLNNPNLISIKSGREYTIPGTRYRVDGFDPLTKTIYEFHGCEFHGHCTTNKNCPLTKNKGSFSYYGDLYVDLYDKTQTRKDELIRLGYKYIEIWECEYKSMK